ncbi:hypothetical protein KAT36_01700 [Candidatus Pacearchaeota archaeon]|nr:hypothetical protein [Candidatus Pacearchaeota archaeon]
MKYPNPKTSPAHSAPQRATITTKNAKQSFAPPHQKPTTKNQKREA